MITLQATLEHHFVESMMVFPGYDVPVFFFLRLNDGPGYFVKYRVTALLQCMNDSGFAESRPSGNDDPVHEKVGLCVEVRLYFQFEIVQVKRYQVAHALASFVHTAIVQVDIRVAIGLYKRFYQL